MRNWLMRLRKRVSNTLCVACSSSEKFKVAHCHRIQTQEKDVVDYVACASNRFKSFYFTETAENRSLVRLLCFSEEDVDTTLHKYYCVVTSMRCYGSDYPVFCVDFHLLLTDFCAAMNLLVFYLLWQYFFF